MAARLSPDDPTDCEAQLCALFGEILGGGPVAPDADFFELGGHSLLAMQAVARIRARLGSNLPVSLIFEHRTPSALAPIVASWATGDTRGDMEPARTGVATATELTPWQSGMWFLEQGAGHHAAYLLPDAWHVRGPIDRNALRAALEVIVARHGALTTRFEVVDGEPRQTVAGAGPFVLHEVDLRHVQALEQEPAIARLAAAEAERPFDLLRDVLLRATLVGLAEEHHVLLLTVHHLAADAWSLRVLRRELEESYRALRQGHAPALPPVRRDPREFLSQQQSDLTPSRRAALGSYWRRQLAGLPPLELPVDRHRTAQWSDEGAELEFEVPEAVLRRLEQLARDRHATLQMVLLAAFQVQLAQYTGQHDFGVATFVSNRRDPAVEAVIGLFVNTVVLRADVSAAPTFADVLARVRATSLEAYDHRDWPFEQVVADLGPHRRGGSIPLTPVAFQYLPYPDAPPQLDGLTLTRRPCATRRVRFDVEITMRQDGNRLHAVLGYSTDLFDRDTMRRFASHYRTLLEAIADDPNARVSQLCMLAGAERHEQLVLWSGASPVTQHEGLVHELFEAQAAKTPDASALLFGGERVTYRQLDDRATALASRLRAAGVQPGDIVALYLDRSVDVILAMLGVLKAGAAYMPLDPSHPDERLAFMLRKAGASTLLASRAVSSSLSEAVAHVMAVGGGPAAEVVGSRRAPSFRGSPTQLAYVMFTSGSTGEPKGVCIPHRGIVRLVRETEYVSFEASDCVAFASNPAFDAATFEVWGALLSGARLANVDRNTLLSPQQLSGAIAEYGITTMFLTAALFHQIAALAPEIFRPLTYVLAGGDVVDPSAAEAVLARGGPRHLLNAYGPTENTTFSTTYAITEAFSGNRTIPIGRPITGSTCYVLDPERQLLPAGAVGELFVGGAGLGLGYLGAEALTAERFVDHPFVDGERLYRTGDRVRWRADGQLEFLGRVDRQVKLRGHRIELEEVEHTLGHLSGVAAAAVVFDMSRVGMERLVAYAVARDGAALSGEALRRGLAERLPSFMVPDVVVVLTALPLTPNGKVDRAALPKIVGQVIEFPTTTSAGEGAQELMTAREAMVADAFGSVLGLDRVALDSDFFAVGGTSLLTFKLVDALRVLGGHPISVQEVFAHPTVRALATRLGSTDTERPRSIVEVRRGGRRTPMYFPPGVLGEGVLHRAFCDELPADVPLYALTDPLDGPSEPSLESMAARFCADIEAFQPEGPLGLAGYSFGGLLAYEMARRLVASGRTVEVLAILDTGPDLSSGRSVRDLVTRLTRCLGNLPHWIAEDVVRSFSKDTPATLWRSLVNVLGTMGGQSSGEGSQQASRSEHLFDVSGWSPALKAHVDNNLRLIEQFRYGAYQGRTVLFRARVRPLLHAQAPDLGWGHLVPDLRVINVPGNHHTMTVEPHVRTVARRLREVLEEPIA
jgi:amino acid adenylation domain-containing protein